MGTVAVAAVAALGFGMAGPAGAATTDEPWMDTALSADERAALLLPRMTLEEKVDLMTDNPAPTGQELAYYNAGIARLGIPELRMADIGPSLRFGQEPTTAFPMGIASAATWNLDGVAQVADAVREEARLKRYNMILGPNVDLPRNPWWSRIAEGYGEDPLLAGRMAASFVSSAQAQGDMAVSLKHYNVYGQETNRNPVLDDDRTQNMIVDERTLQELYTRPWASPVAVDVASVMCAFGKINGIQACENEHLNEDILRDQLGFDGFILTDYGATRPRTEATIEGGINMETGAVVAYGEDLLLAVNEGRVAESLVDERVLQVLRTYFEYGIFDNPVSDALQPVPEEEHAALSRTIAEQAITLLKNDGSALPLDDSDQTDSIAVVGQGASWLAQQCCAGAATNPTREVTPLQAIQDIAPDGTTVTYARGTDAPFAADLIQGPDAIPSSVLSLPGASTERGVQAQYFDNTDLTGEPLETRTNLRAAYDNGLIAWFWNHPEVLQPPTGSVGARLTGDITAPATGEYRLSLSGFGTASLVLDGNEILSFTDEITPDQYVSEPIAMTAGQTYAFELNYAATNPRDGLDTGMVRLGWVPPAGVVSPDIQEAVALAQQADVAVVVAGLSETEARDRGELDLATEQDELIEAVSAVNPRTVVVLQGGGGILMPWLDDVEGVIQTYYTGGDGANALADILFGNVNPTGKLPISYPASEEQPAEVLGVENSLLDADEPDVDVSNNVNIGYRGYAAAGAEPLFPFGFGLSYTSYDYADVETSVTDGTVSAEFTLTNAGDRAGSEIAQVYAGTLPTDVVTPAQQLAGWARVDLEPGESKRVVVELACKSLAYYDTAQAAWLSPAGSVELTVGASSQDIRLTGAVTLPGGACSEASDLEMNATTGPVEEDIENVALPAISGDPDVGKTLTATPGEWSTDATFSYQWVRNGEPIPGATTDQYKVVRADQAVQLTVRVTATASGGSSSSADSAPVTIRTRAVVIVTTTPLIVATTTKSVTVKVTVRPLALQASGEVTIQIAGRSYTGTVINGRVSIDVGKLPRGTYRITASYGGNDTVSPSTGYGLLVVRR